MFGNFSWRKRMKTVEESMIRMIDYAKQAMQDSKQARTKGMRLEEELKSLSSQVYANKTDIEILVQRIEELENLKEPEMAKRGRKKAS